MKQKKILVVGIWLAGVMFPAWAQYENITVGDSCSYFGESMPYSVTSFRSDTEADVSEKTEIYRHGILIETIDH